MRVKSKITELWSEFSYYKHHAPKEVLPTLKPTSNPIIKYLFSLYGPFVEVEKANKILQTKGYREEELAKVGTELVYTLHNSRVLWMGYAYKLQIVLAVSLVVNFLLFIALLVKSHGA